MVLSSLYIFYIYLMDLFRGGTEILEPLRDIASKAVSDQVPRQVFIITDGQVGRDG